jgi:hypothetical protein
MDPNIICHMLRQCKGLPDLSSRNMPDIFPAAASGAEGSPALPRLKELLRALFIPPKRVTADILVVRLMVDGKENDQVTREVTEYMLNPIVRELDTFQTLENTLDAHSVMALGWIQEGMDKSKSLKQKLVSTGRQLTYTHELQLRSEEKQMEIVSLISLLKQLTGVREKEMTSFVQAHKTPPSLQFLVDDPALQNMLLMVATPAGWEIISGSWQHMMRANWGHEHQLRTLQDQDRDEHDNGNDDSHAAHAGDHSKQDATEESSDDNRPLVDTTASQKSSKNSKKKAPESPAKSAPSTVRADGVFAKRTDQAVARTSSRVSAQVQHACCTSTHDQNVCMQLTCTAGNCDLEHVCNNRMRREKASRRRAPWIATHAHGLHHVSVCMHA